MTSTRSERGRGRIDKVPAPALSFVGRDRELARISDLLMTNDTVRLVTLFGPGGIGKTSLAAEAVRRHTVEVDGVQVYWVRLARLPPDADSEQIETETAAAVVGVDFSDRSTWASLVDTLTNAKSAGSTPILVLDNCEHVLPSVRRLVSELFDFVSALTVVATSRSSIGWDDEQLINTPPLSAAQALQLFRQRAELVDRPLTDDAQHVLAAEICRHVNHIPLFVQLAAARLSHRALAAIRNELTGRAEDDRRLEWPSKPRAGVEPRHQAVTDVVAWSYSLCSDQEQALFDRLSVFAAGDPAEYGADVGTDLEAIEAICADDDAETGTVSRDEVEALLEALADHSLVNLHFADTAVRYSLPETLRVFAGARLRRRGPDEAGRLASRHLRYYRDKITDAAATWYSPAEQDLLDWARAAWTNLLIAIETSLTVPEEAPAGLEICLGLIALRTPFLRGSIREIRRWTERCLAATDTLDPRPAYLQATAKAAIAWLAVRQGQSNDADAMLDQCVDLCRPDLTGHANWRDGDGDLANLPTQWQLTWGTQLFLARRDPRAIDVLVRARDLFAGSGNRGAAMMAGMFAGMAAGLLDTVERAHDIARQCLDDARASGAAWATSWAEMPWGISLFKAGNPTEAANVLRHALKHQVRIRDQWGAQWSIEILTWALGTIISSADDTADRAEIVAIATEIAQLAGGVRQLRAKLGITIESMGTFADESTRAIAVARQVLGSEDYAAAERMGTQLRPDDGSAYDLALGNLTLTTSDSIVPWHGALTRIEKDVAILAAAGLKNRDIARIQRKAEATVKVQIVSILRKLGIDNRGQILPMVPESCLADVESARREYRRWCALAADSPGAADE